MLINSVWNPRATTRAVSAKKTTPSVKLDSLNSLSCSPLFASGGGERKIKPSQLDPSWAMENKRRESGWSTEKYLFIYLIKSCQIFPRQWRRKILCQRCPYLDSIQIASLRQFDLILSRRKVNANSGGQKTLVTEETGHSSLMRQVGKLGQGGIEPFDPRSCVNWGW